jgi:hypothetical protein
MKYKELSANTVAFISCRRRLPKVLAGASRWKKGSKGGAGRVLLSKTVGMELQGDMLFQIGGRHDQQWHMGVCE